MKRNRYFYVRFKDWRDGRGAAISTAAKGLSLETNGSPMKAYIALLNYKYAQERVF